MGSVMINMAQMSSSRSVVELLIIVSKIKRFGQVDFLCWWMFILITSRQRPLEKPTMRTPYTCCCLNDGDNYGGSVVPRANVRPVWNNVVSWDEMVSLPGIVGFTAAGKQFNEAKLCWHDILWVSCICIFGASSSVSCLPLLQHHSIYQKNMWR